MNAAERIQAALERLLVEARTAGMGQAHDAASSFLDERSRALVEAAASEIVVSVRELIAEEIGRRQS